MYNISLRTLLNRFSTLMIHNYLFSNVIVSIRLSNQAVLQLAEVSELREKVVFLEGNSDQPCIVRLPNFNGVCG